MDTVSQALWGALNSQAVPVKKKLQVPAWLIGLVGGTLPDLDVFFKNASDPMFTTLIHRHFTHSIFFIPIGALLTWLLFWPFFRKNKEHYWDYYKIAIAGYGTHWVLDLLTAYGTLIFWPISNHRFSLDWLSIVDPLLTIPWFIAFILILIFNNKKQITTFILAYSFVYFFTCGLLHKQAANAIYEVAKIRGHQIERVRALPTLGNSVWFRTIYLYESKIYADSILIRPFDTIYWKSGEAVQHLKNSDLETLLPEVKRQLDIWEWFTDGWMYIYQSHPLEIGDGRYSAQTETFEPMWVLKLDLTSPKQSSRSRPDLTKLARKREPFRGYELLLKPVEFIPLNP